MAHFNIIKISYFFFNTQNGFNIANAKHCLVTIKPIEH